MEFCLYRSFERFEHVEYLTWEDNNDIAEYPMDETEAANLEQNFLDDNACNDEALLHDENHQQAANDPETDDDNHDTDKVFYFAGVFCRKLYCSQLRPREFEKRYVSGNTLADVLKSIWKVAKTQVHRAVIFTNEVPRWANDDPNVDNIQQFVTLQDTKKKKLYHVSSLTPRLLRNWRDKTVRIFVYVYSSTVENNAQYQLVQRKLIVPQNPDRSGANSAFEELTLANELRDKHPDIEGHHSSWLLWANFINSSPVHERDQLKASKAPPLELAKYFRWTAVSEAARLQSVHRGVVVAQTVNEGWSRDISTIKKDLDLAITVLQGVMSRLEALELRAESDAKIFSAMSSVTQPEETEISRQLSAKIVDCTDVDHQ